MKQCSHENTHPEEWPDGGIEVCDDCGMSRHVWEWGESGWIMVHDIPKCRKKLQEYIDCIKAMHLKKIKKDL